MSIWGKIVGGAAGFALGGPLGALIGVGAGHAVDRITEGISEPGDATQSIAFTIGVIALSAKMAKADGEVTDDEVAAFKRVFRVPAEEQHNVDRVFNLARRDARGFEPYARQLGTMFKDRPAVLEELLGCLFTIAKADNRIHPSEIDYLRNVAKFFGLDDATFERIRTAETGPDTADPYFLLGVTRDATDEGVKAAYRRLVRENHPDQLIAQGMPSEFVEIATARMARINDAYDRIARERGLR